MSVEFVLSFGYTSGFCACSFINGVPYDATGAIPDRVVTDDFGNLCFVYLTR